MKIFIFAIILLLFQIKNEINTSKMLIIYYSNSGNTKLLSEYIIECLNMEIFQIIPVNEYPSDTKELSYLSKKERTENARPEIKNPLTTINNYDKILLGYPIWNSYLPCIVITQLLKLNFSGITIYPFNTHEGSGIGNTFNEIKLYTPGAIIKKELDIEGSTIKNNKEDSIKEIKKWLSKNFGYQYDYVKKSKFKVLFIILYIFIFRFE